MKLSDQYDRLADVYNSYFGAEACRGTVTAMVPILRALVPPPARILDLCCGCGHVSARLCQHGYEVTGVDISDRMLHYARRNAPAATFLKQDARSVNVANDATVCAFNSIAHFTSDELSELFAAVAAGLGRTGVFMFDIYLEESYKQRWNGQFSIAAGQAHVTVTGRCLTEERMAENIITVVSDKERVDVRLAMHIHSLSDLRTLLGQAGFSSVHICHVKSGPRDLTEADRIVFLAAKYELRDPSITVVQNSSPERR